MSSSAIRALLQSTKGLHEQLTTGVDTEKALEEASKHFSSQIHEGSFLIDPHTVGEEPVSKYKPEKSRTREESIARLRWCTRLDSTPDGEESDGSDSASSVSELERLVGRYTLTINEEYYLLEEYLGKEREEIIREMCDIRDQELPDPLTAARARFPWQKTGTAMMKKSRKTFGGCINMDEMGLGKTIQTLDDIVDQERRENDAYSLVCTEKAVLTTWAREGGKSYIEGHQPRVMILDDTRISFADLWEGDFDIVVASYASIMYQFHRQQKFKRFVGLWRFSGREEAMRIAEKERLPTKRPTLPVFTALLEILPFRIPIKVLDEAHRLKKWSGKQRAAIQAVLSETVNLLSGTPCGNVWTDIFALCALLPYEPFIGRAEYIKVFIPAHAASRHKPPTSVEFANIVRYLLGFSFGRTVDQLNIPGIIYEPDFEFELDGVVSEKTLWLIDKFIRIARMKSEEATLNEEEMKTAMGYCTKAEQESGFPVLATYSEKQLKAMKEKPLDMTNSRILFGGAVNDERDRMILEHGRLPEWAETSIDELSGAAYTKAMIQWLIDRGFAHIYASREEGSIDPAFEDTDITSAAPKTRGKRNLDTFMDEDFDPTANEDDLQDLLDEELEPDDDNTPGIAGKQKRKEKKSKFDKFQEDVKAMSDDQIFTPRCNALMVVYQRIQENFPGEKMIIWSRFYKALVLIGEAFRRSKKLTPPIYSGLLDTKERTSMLGRWEHDQLTPSSVPILFQAKAGGTGLTVNAASQVIFFDPWWNKLDEAQAERRCVRLGQKKEVHVWRLIALNSFADAIICAGGLRKLLIIDRLMAALRPPKGTELTIPKHTVQVGGIGYINYDYYKNLDEKAKREQEGAIEEARAGAEAGEIEEGTPAKRAKSELAEMDNNSGEQSDLEMNLFHEGSNQDDAGVYDFEVPEIFEEVGV
ncbi:hypothetical protein N0V83_007598 [Neocucurbitaria cava]|uniref:Uncharacterized protein n=1 Tax=Neocucurbitaria cava TaxID=798079 RepID=A0A9W8Y457_9PLEO|nr:hypothetical protein N0V83_007598 [Neocucurbitaria cava]